MRLIVLPALLVALMLGPAIAADVDRSAPAVSATGKTGKERLSDKGSDEQRVDDCKVPQARRTRDRPAACPWDVGS